MTQEEIKKYLKEHLKIELYSHYESYRVYQGVRITIDGEEINYDIENMKQEYRELLIEDLCARLPYCVKISIPELWISEKKIEVLNEIFKGDDGLYRVNDSGMLIEHIKPYLFPLSSMTEEQKKELRDMEWSFDDSTICNILECFGTYRAYVDHSCCFELIKWFNKNHFDYRGLIPLGLANDATGLNIY